MSANSNDDASTHPQTTTEREAAGRAPEDQVVVKSPAVTSSDIPAGTPGEAPVIIPATFQRIEPIEDGFDPSDDEDFRFIEAADRWRAIAMSVRGLSHQHHGLYREDALDLRYVAPWFLAAVCDGAGSSKLARIGAREASRAAVSRMLTVIQASKASFVASAAPAEARLTNLLLDGVKAAYDAVIVCAEKLRCPVKELYTTLLLAAHGHFEDGRQVVASAQLGDGAICAYIETEEESGRVAELGAAEQYDYAGVARFLNQVTPDEWPDRVWVRHLPAQTTAISLMTDGVSEDFKPLDKQLWRLMRALRKEVLPFRDPLPLRDHFRMLVNYELVGSFDDRTILVIHQPPNTEGSA